MFLPPPAPRCCHRRCHLFLEVYQTLCLHNSTCQRVSQGNYTRNPKEERQKGEIKHRPCLGQSRIYRASSGSSTHGAEPTAAALRIAKPPFFPDFPEETTPSHDHAAHPPLRTASAAREHASPVQPRLRVPLGAVRGGERAAAAAAGVTRSGITRMITLQIRGTGA